MSGRLRELLRLDLDAIDSRKGLSGLVAIVIGIGFVLIFGTAGITAALSALFVIATDGPGRLRARVSSALGMVVAGAAIGLVALWTGTEGAWMAVLLTLLVTAAGTLAAGLGRSAGIRGLLLSIWAIVALGLGGESATAIELTVAYVAGGLIATAIIWFRARVERADDEPVAGASLDLARLLRSPLGWFSLLRAAAAAVAMAIGVLIFPEHAIWGTLTVLLVMRPRAGEAVTVGVLRSLGTLVGVLVAEAVFAVAGRDDIVLAAGFLAAGFGMVALQHVNYAVFVACLTALLVFASELIGGTGDSAAIDRLAETVTGAFIAFVAIGIGRWIIVRQRMGGHAELALGADEDSADSVPG